MPPTQGSAERESDDARGEDAGAAPSPAAVDAIARGMRVPWTLRQVIWGICLTALPLTVLQVAVQLTPGAHASVPTRPLSHTADLVTAVTVFFTSTLLEAIFLIPPIYHTLRTRERGTSIWHGLQALGFRRFPLTRAALLFVVGFVAYLAFSQLYGLFNIPTNADALRRQALFAPDTTIATLLVAVTVAPFCEEVFFRGYVFPPVARAIPMWAAILVTSLFFAAVHADLGSFVPLMAIGVVLTILRWRTTSIWPGMLFHALNNGLASVYVLVVLAPHAAHL
jgi:uncharacterized protein